MTPPLKRSMWVTSPASLQLYFVTIPLASVVETGALKALWQIFETLPRGLRTETGKSDLVVRHLRLAASVIDGCDAGFP